MARWSKQKNETGLAKACQAERGYTLKEKGESIISVRIDYLDRWYWYGIGRNTFSEGLFFKTKDEAKINADLAYKDWRAHERNL